MQLRADSGRLRRRGAGLALVLCLGCTGSSQSARPEAATPIPDEAPPRAVPEASQLVRQGEARLQAQDAAAAQVLFERAIAEDPNDARAHLDLGIAREMQNDPAGAAAAYRRAIAADENFAEALNNLGVLLRDGGQLDEAIDLLERATRANPRSVAAHTNLALALEDQGDLGRAETAYRAALSLDAANVMTRVNLGMLLLESGQTDAAVQELRGALQNAQGNRPALVAIGNGLRRAGDKQGALQAMQAAVHGGEDVTPALLSELALAQLATGDRDAAITSLHRALEIDPRFASAHYLLAGMLAGAGRAAEAKQHYERYLALEPRGPHADKARERIKVLKQRR
jgi:Tfp pilus assembly protein PilF